MENDELRIELVDGGEIIARRDNTRLYTFIGNAATRNHVFIATGVSEENENLAIGTYIFGHNEAYAPVVEWIIEHEFPMLLNESEVQDCDEDAFQKSLDTLDGAFDDFEIPDGL